MEIYEWAEDTTRELRKENDERPLIFPRRYETVILSHGIVQHICTTGTERLFRLPRLYRRHCDIYRCTQCIQADRMNPQPAWYYCINQWSRRPYVLSDREFQFRNPRPVPETRSDRAVADRATIRDPLAISEASSIIDFLFILPIGCISNLRHSKAPSSIIAFSQLISDSSEYRTLHLFYWHNYLVFLYLLIFRLSILILRYWRGDTTFFQNYSELRSSKLILPFLFFFFFYVARFHSTASSRWFHGKEQPLV